MIHDYWEDDAPSWVAADIKKWLRELNYDT